MTKPEYSEKDDELLKKLGELEESKPTSKYTPREERIITGFEDIQRFYDKQGRPPLHGEDRDIFERMYAVRLDQLIAQDDCRDLLRKFDHQHLLSSRLPDTTEEADDIDDDEILKHFPDDPIESDITDLKHVRSVSERQSPDEIASRKTCEDFSEFEQLFVKVQHELNAGIRETREFKRKAEITQGKYFIVGGQIAYVAERDTDFLNEQGKVDARLRVIFNNRTESNLLMRSLQRALSQDETGRRITEPEVGPLFSDELKENDKRTGVIYVLRSLSEDENVKQHHEYLHKIGVTTGSVERRIQNARYEPTYLCADVQVVMTIDLFNIDPVGMERLLHKIFDRVRCNLEIKDRFGKPVSPKEWFMVPTQAIEEAVELIKSESIADYTFDTNTLLFARK